MATNDFLSFATGGNANVTPQSDWKTLPAVTSGFTSGKASSAQVNKAIRQATFIASGLAQFVSDTLLQDILDNGNSAAFVTALKQAIVNGSVPAGIPMPWPAETPPAGWLKCNGANFNTSTYPLLAKAYPAGKLPDLRGEFLRGWDDGRGLDSGRAILSMQGDAIRQMTGSVANVWTEDANSSEGVLAYNGTGFNLVPLGSGSSVQFRNLKFNAASQVPTANENRPHNVAFNYIVRAA
ncbi:TPA: tail fiber protein [Klebsiella aerogenes]|nr:tail fiber protein [Klebsiella aerogenes]